MFKNFIIFIILTINFILYSSCDSHTDHLNIDVSKIQIDLTFDRMEQDLFDTTKDPKLKHQELLSKYGLLYEFFFAEMIRGGNPYTTEAPDILNAFVNDTYIQSIIKAVNAEFKDFSPYEIELTKAFKHFKYYFPDSKIPAITTFFSYFNSNVYETEGRLGIGIDMYLGKDNSIVKKLPGDLTPQYLKNKMENKYLVANAMYGFLHNRFYNPTENDFISIIIEKGKVLYLLKAMLPETPDHILMCYSENDIAWCNKNEIKVWEHLVDQTLIYSKDAKSIADFTSDGPFTRGLENSPARVGEWMGYQIVNDFVNENNIEVLDLLKEKNAKTILKSYNPNE